MPGAKSKSLMRNLGEFFGHVYRAVRSDPARKRTEVRRTVEEERRGRATLRRTTIEEIEVRREPDD